MWKNLIIDESPIIDKGLLCYGGCAKAATKELDIHILHNRQELPHQEVHPDSPVLPVCDSKDCYQKVSRILEKRIPEILFKDISNTSLINRFSEVILAIERIETSIQINSYWGEMSRKYLLKEKNQIFAEIVKRMKANEKMIDSRKELD